MATSQENTLKLQESIGTCLKRTTPEYKVSAIRRLMTNRKKLDPVVISELDWIRRTRI